MSVNIGIAIALAIVGVLCVAYGLHYALSETKVRFHYVWFALAAVLVAPAILMAVGVWDDIPVALHWVVVGALLLLVVYEVVVGLIIGSHFNDKAVPDLDYIVVPGAQILDGKPGRTFRERLDVATAYLTDNPRTRCVVCGGQGPYESVPEANSGRDYLVEHGIEADRVLLEDRSHSTAQNLYFAAELIDPLHDSVGIITTDYHMARSLALARKAGIAHVSGITVKSFELFPLSSIVRESIAWAKDILLGNA